MQGTTGKIISLNWFISSILISETFLLALKKKKKKRSTSLRTLPFLSVNIMTTTEKSGLAVGVREETAVWVNRTGRGSQTLSIPTGSVHGWCLGSERLSFLGAANLTVYWMELKQDLRLNLTSSLGGLLQDITQLYTLTYIKIICNNRLKWFNKSLIWYLQVDWLPNSSWGDREKLKNTMLSPAHTSSSE